ncbi:MAG: ABC transporter permease subunit [Leptolinea sp.]|jgi:hypothetical protein|nr:ABC transporter permease subunit [Leptolinea sp.]
MTCLVRAVQAEILKSKRTLMVALTFLAPLSMAFLEIAILFNVESIAFKQSQDTWITLINHATQLWVLLLLPLFITLQMGLMGAMEHNNRAWKQLYTRPLPRWSIYMAKQLVGAGLIGLSSLILGLMIVGVGLVGQSFRPELGFSAIIPWSYLWKAMFYPFLASWLIISIHTFVSLYSSSFVAAMGLGIVATVFGVVVIGTKYEPYDPWIMPGVVAHNLANNQSFLLPLVTGIVGGLIIACLGCALTIRKDVLE